MIDPRQIDKTIGKRFESKYIPEPMIGIIAGGVRDKASEQARRNRLRLLTLSEGG